MQTCKVITKSGEWVIPGSRRPDGSWRKPRRVKEGYVPQDEMPVYENKGVQWMKSRPDHPIGLSPEDVEKHQHAKGGGGGGGGDTAGEGHMSRNAKKNAKKRERKKMMEQKLLDEVLNAVEETHIAPEPLASDNKHDKPPASPKGQKGKKGKTGRSKQDSLSEETKAGAATESAKQDKGAKQNREQSGKGQKPGTVSAGKSEEEILEIKKKIRNVKKKLKQIHELEDKDKAGENLSPEQREKMSRRGTLEKELQQLEKALS